MEVQTIKATHPVDKLSEGNIRDKLRVAAYCRVSTDEEEQHKSYTSMVKYYTDYIKSKDEWIFAGVYADEATTGTSVTKRVHFQELIDACMNGEIDLVLAKSLSRFARNTYDTLKYVRMLKEKGVAIYFEVEKINTMKDGEFLMTILSSVAQQEVENTSANVKKGLKMRMKRGELIGFNNCLGYDYDKVEHKLIINEEGARIVRYIFERYVTGVGSRTIARELNEQGYVTLRGNPWNGSGVLGILKNEKYKGDLLLGKTITVSPLTKRRVKNKGEEDQYYVEDHHEPIISEELFEQAKRIREGRNVNRDTVIPGKRICYSRKYAFSGMIDCGFCGEVYTRRSWHGGSAYKKVIWTCSALVKGCKQLCPNSKAIHEEIIEQAFLESYKLLYSSNKGVVDEFLDKVEESLGDKAIKNKLKKNKSKINENKKKRKALLEKYIDGNVDEELYKETDNEYIETINDLEEERKTLAGQLDNEESLKERLVSFRKALSSNMVPTEFDRAIFESVVERIIIGGYDEQGNKDPYKITFIYKTGFPDSIDNAKDRFGKRRRRKKSLDLLRANELKKKSYDARGGLDDGNEEMHSNIIDDDKKMHSNLNDDTCRDHRADRTDQKC